MFSTAGLLVDLFVCSDFARQNKKETTGGISTKLGLFFLFFFLSFLGKDQDKQAVQGIFFPFPLVHIYEGVQFGADPNDNPDLFAVIWFLTGAILCCE